VSRRDVLNKVTAGKLEATPERLYAHFTIGCGDWEALAWIVRDLRPESGGMAVKVLDADLTSGEAISIPHHESETQVSRKAPVHGLLGRADIEGLPVGVPLFRLGGVAPGCCRRSFPLGGVEVWGYRRRSGVDRPPGGRSTLNVNHIERLAPTSERAAWHTVRTHTCDRGPRRDQGQPRPSTTATKYKEHQ